MSQNALQDLRIRPADHRNDRPIAHNLQRIFQRQVRVQERRVFGRGARALSLFALRGFVSVDAPTARLTPQKVEFLRSAGATQRFGQHDVRFNLRGVAIRHRVFDAQGNSFALLLNGRQNHALLSREEIEKRCLLKLTGN